MALASLLISASVVWHNIPVLTEGWPVKGPDQMLPHYLVAPLSTLLLAWAIFFSSRAALQGFSSVRSSLRTTEGRTFHISFAIVFLFFLAVIASQYPGWIIEDAIYTYHMARSGFWSGWYSPVNPLIYTLLLQIIPSILFVTICNAALAAYVIAAFCSKAAKNLRSIKAPLLVAVITAVLPVTMAMILMPIRDSFFTSFLLLFVLLVYGSLRRENSAMRLVLMGALGGLVAVYRIDAAPSILVLVCVTALFSKGSPQRKAVALCSQIIGCFAIFAAVNAIPHILGDTWEKRAENEYKMTIISLPLTNLVKDGVYPAASDPRRQAIEKVFKYEDLRRLWHPTNILIFYGGGFNEKSSVAEREAAASAAVSLFLENPGSFLAGRFSLFLATTGLSNMNPFVYYSIADLEKRGVALPLQSSWVKQTGEAFEGFMLKTQNFDGMTLSGRFLFWNVLPAFLIFSVIILAWPYCPKAALISAPFLLREAVVFLSAPAAFFHYHFSTYIGAILIALLAYSEWKAATRKVA